MLVGLVGVVQAQSQYANSSSSPTAAPQAQVQGIVQGGGGKTTTVTTTKQADCNSCPGKTVTETCTVTTTKTET